MFTWHLKIDSWNPDKVSYEEIRRIEREEFNTSYEANWRLSALSVNHDIRGSICLKPSSSSG